MIENYPELRLHLKKQTNALTIQQPGVVKAFHGLHDAAMEEGKLSTRFKELIALAIAIADRCDACISFHVHEALAWGATPEEISECVGVAIMMGGGPSLMYGAKAMDAVCQFQNARQKIADTDGTDMVPLTAPD